jgi:hypothetical protein
MLLMENDTFRIVLKSIILFSLFILLILGFVLRRYCSVGKLNTHIYVDVYDSLNLIKMLD